MTHRRIIARTGFTTLLVFALFVSARAQEPEAAPPAADPQATPAPKPKPRPRMKPKPTLKPEVPPASANDPNTPAKPDANSIDVRRAEPVPEVRPGLAPDGAAKLEPAAPATSQTAIVAPPVACDPGKSILYDSANGFSLWVTRAGAVTIDNPLRPLTPEVTRVLQLVIGGKLATAYGADLTALRRGGAPGVLEASLGGPIRWDATLGTLPDTLNIVADSGAALAAMRFKECGDAPAVKVIPVARAKKGSRTGESAKAVEAVDPAKDKAEKPRVPRRTPAVDQGGQPSPRAAAPGTRPFNVPQGAISE